MNRNIPLFTILYLVLVLVQVLICNRIDLFGVAVPFIFIYFIIALPTRLNSMLLYTLAFFLGLTVDIFSDTAGMNALACVLLSAAKTPALYAYIPKDDRTLDIIPSIASLGWIVYAKYLVTMTAIYCFLIFSIEYFSFGSLGGILLMTLGSTLLTAPLLMAVDSLTMRK